MASMHGVKVRQCSQLRLAEASPTLVESQTVDALHMLAPRRTNQGGRRKAVWPEVCKMDEGDSQAGKPWTGFRAVSSSRANYMRFKVECAWH
jgi:hypothetical protein